MRLADLKGLAQQMGLKGLSGKRKGELVAMIEGARRPGPAKAQAAAPAKASTGTSGTAESSGGGADSRGGDTTEATPPAASSQTSDPQQQRSVEGDGDRRSAEASTHGDSGKDSDRSRSEDGNHGGQRQGRDQGGRQRRGGQGRDDQGPGQQSRDQQGGRNRDQQGGDQQGGRNRDQQGGDQGGRNRDQQGGDQGGRNRDQQGGRNRDNDDRDQQAANSQGSGNQGDGNGPRGDGNNRDDDGGGRGRRSRRRRERNRGGNRQNDGDTEVREDDVLQPVAGILDVLDNYAFVRTSGYLAGTNDVYVSMNMIRRHGLRRGDAITGAVKMPRDGQNDGQGGNQGGNQGGGKNRQKFNPLVRIDTVNGGPIDQARNRVDFSKLTPLYPNQRLRLETEKNIISTRVIDLIMPIGKGQRALIVSPPKAGKTTILQNIANAIATNNPECHLMVVLVDERPEEVTDMQRSVKGEVIASTFDRPPSDHTQVAELAIERAKRLVELGQDVVVLLDSITRLGRAYNNSSPASGRILSGGVDSTALYPPKRFLGAARNIENGGSLTIIATAMVETGSAGDTVIFEEFKGTGNAELKLDRRIAERRVFPAVDVGPSGTRKEELLMSPEEAGIMHKLRRVLSGLDTHQAIDLLMSQLRKTNTNYEFLLQVAKTTPTLPQDEE
ncbi:transcription termination factor Rho [Dietzia aurantiaca]|uniref:transcription termination factor Rho n=1 Tax=Dietzia aurantiaca TaxID=983873 RepID=UPI001E2D6262|nr:transcription termination factor Rho [Dietzia aurantiaca]MCD2263293.1 transcription termination factor Rho [Dietzia aurantiaca]